MKDLIKLLRDGAAICESRQINLDYAKVALEAATAIEQLMQENLARSITIENLEKDSKRWDLFAKGMTYDDENLHACFNKLVAIVGDDYDAMVPIELLNSTFDETIAEIEARNKVSAVE